MHGVCGRGCPGGQTHIPWDLPANPPAPGSAGLQSWLGALQRRPPPALASANGFTPLLPLLASTCPGLGEHCSGTPRAPAPPYLPPQLPSPGHPWSQGSKITQQCPGGGWGEVHPCPQGWRSPKAGCCQLGIRMGSPTVPPACPYGAMAPATPLGTGEGSAPQCPCPGGAKIGDNAAAQPRSSHPSPPLRPGLYF